MLIATDQSHILQSSIYAHPALYDILKLCATLEPICYVAAGAIRNVLWSDLHGHCEPLTEIDVIYYDEFEIGQHQQQHIESTLKHALPQYTWDVVNQAQVHTWYKTESGQSILPLGSVSHALSLWPETATAIAVRWIDDHHMGVIAPFGLDDLINLKLRWNKRLVSHTVFKQRINQKHFLQRWPKLQEVEPYPSNQFVSDHEMIISMSESP